MARQTADIAIVGGGASAMAAAVTAARLGCSVTVLERLDRVCKKLLQTGNGRCNITNKNISIKNFHGKNPAFAMAALKEAGFHETTDFFESIGIVLASEKDGKMFPQSFQASSVLDLLRIEMNRLGVTEVTGFFVQTIKKDGDCFKIISDKGEKAYAKKVIVAAGGMAAPHTGTDGSGYKLLTGFGHTLVKPLPSLVQLKAKNPVRGFKGVKQDGEVTIIVQGKEKRVQTGEVLFTDYGLSGPPVFNVSPIASSAIAMGKDVLIKINFLPRLDKVQAKHLLQERARTLPHLWGEDFLNGILNKRIGRHIMKISRDINDVTAHVTGFEVEVSGTMPFANAQTTSGGIDVAGFDPRTMESLLVPGLYAAGEVLDIDGDCGGYNLQWAWSSGILAGRSAGEML